MINPEILAREKILFAYSLALEQGDFARMEKILEQAGTDPILERQILEINATLSQPQAESSAAASPGIPAENLLQWIKNSLTSLTSHRLWTRPVMRTAAVILAVFIVLLVIGDALLGPAVGNIFSNIVSYAPPSRGLQNERLPGQPPASTQLSSTTRQGARAVTPTPYIETHTDAYSAYLAPQSQPQPAGRLIVRNASLSLVVKDTRLARQAVVGMMAEYAAEGAFVVSASETYPTNGQMPVISMTLRVPVKRYDESMTRLAGLGIQVLDRQENAQDVTQDYVDVSARVEALETSRSRLLEIVKEAKNTEDLLRAEEELSRREAELEAAKASQKYLEQTSALSSITLELQPPAISQPVTDNTWNPAVTFHNALRTLLASLRGFADGLIYFSVATLPWLAALGLLVYITVRIFRKR
jgi:hypothetical protein